MKETFDIKITWNKIYINILLISIFCVRIQYWKSLDPLIFYHTIRYEITIRTIC